MSENFSILILAITNLVFVILVVKLISDWIKLRHRKKMYAELINKFSSSKEFADFMSTEGGGNFIKTFSLKELSSKEKIISSCMYGVIITILGISSIAIGLIFEVYSKEFIILGILATALGIGFLVSTVISYSLSKRWGLFER